MDGVELEFDDKALEKIADMALENKTGARGLRAIIENFMTQIMFEVANDLKIKKCVIKSGADDKNFVHEFIYGEKHKRKRLVKQAS